MKYAIIMPAGSGKSTISKKYDDVYDIDEFHTIDMKESCIKALETNNWKEHNKLEYNMIHEEIQKLPHNSIVLLHGLEKAILYELKPLGSFKIKKSKMLEIAERRGNKNGEWHRIITIQNWESIKDAVIFDTFEEIENNINALRRKIKI